VDASPALEPGPLQKITAKYHLRPVGPGAEPRLDFTTPRNGSSSPPAAGRKCYVIFSFIGKMN